MKDSLSRRQFLVALSAGVFGGMQFDRFLGGDDDPMALAVRGVDWFAPADARPPETLALVETAASTTPNAPLRSPDDSSAAPSQLGDAPDLSSQPPAVEFSDAPPDTTLPETAASPGEAASESSETTTIDTDLDPDVDYSVDTSASPAGTDGELAPLLFSGANLSTWETTLGDSRHTATGLEPVNGEDVVTDHAATHSTLVSNFHGRGVMAHNTTYLRRTDPNALRYAHRARTEFRTPRKPERISGLPNGQTAEIALSAWDGTNSRRNFVVAMQWVINPWSPDFGGLRTWRSYDGDTRWSDDTVATLDPSDEWQEVEFFLDPFNEQAEILINGSPIPSEFVPTKKPDNWAYRNAAAFAVELVSIWPGDRVEAPTTRLEARNWNWQWEPVA